MTEDTSFNLIDEPWILVRHNDGGTRELSLKETFLNWTEIRELVGELPTVSFAIQRLLMAILYRAAATQRDAVTDADVWMDLWQDPDGYSENVLSYLEEYRDRFDLRHPDFPFFQVADLHSARNEISNLERLVVDSPLGGLFTTRTAAGLSRISWGEAARWLVHAHAFDVAGIKTGMIDDPRVKKGKGYGIGTGWAGRIGGLALKGNHLFESLLLNLVPIQMDGLGLVDINPEDDLPPWERPPLGPAMRDDTDNLDPTGPVDLYTWQSRRIRLFGDSNGVIGVVLGQGDRMLPSDRQLYEPMTAWQYSDFYSREKMNASYTPQKHDPSMAFWRSLPSVIPQLDHIHMRKSVDRKSQVPEGLSPGIMKWLQYLIYLDTVGYSQLVQLTVTGFHYGPKESVISDVIADTLSIPASILSDDGEPERHNLRRALKQSEEVGKALGYFAQNLSTASGLPSGEAARNSTRAVFFSQAGQEFTEWISNPSLDRETTRHDWELRIGTIADDITHELIINAPESAIAGREVSEGNRMDLGIAEVRLFSALRRELPLHFKQMEPIKSSDGQGSGSE